MHTAISSVSVTSSPGYPPSSPSVIQQFSSSNRTFICRSRCSILFLAVFQLNSPSFLASGVVWNSVLFFDTAPFIASVIQLLSLSYQELALNNQSLDSAVQDIGISMILTSGSVFVWLLVPPPSFGQFTTCCWVFWSNFPTAGALNTPLVDLAGEKLTSHTPMWFFLPSLKIWLSRRRLSHYFFLSCGEQGRLVNLIEGTVPHLFGVILQVFDGPSGSLVRWYTIKWEYRF